MRATGLGLLVAFFAATHVSATTFIVPSDRDLVRGADSIVVGRVLASYTQLAVSGAIETVTLLDVDEVLKGTATEGSLRIHEPGGWYRDRFEAIDAVPQFRDGERVLLFLDERRDGDWVVRFLALGKFSLATDGEGRPVALRDEASIHGWSVDGLPHQEPRRDATKFLAFLRAVIRGSETDAAYFLSPGVQVQRVVSSSHSTYSPSSYLLTPARRWNFFPQTFTYSNTLEGAESGGSAAISYAMGMWGADAGSNPDLVNGGLDASKTNGALGAADGANTINFERDLTSVGAPAYVCGAEGVMGVTNIRSSGSHAGPDALTFSTVVEADIDMNQGLANCASVLTSSNLFVRGLAHEIGHTLGFRHADRNEDGTAPCSGDKECVPARPTAPDPDDGPNAIMRSQLAVNMNAELQPWDVNAERAVYPQINSAPPPAATGLTATATSSTSITVMWSAAATATSYRIYRRTTGQSFAQVVAAHPSTNYVDTNVTASTAYEYMVLSRNDFGGANDFSNRDFAFTAVYSQSVVSGEPVTAADFEEMRTVVNGLRALTGSQAPFSFSVPTPVSGVTISASHMLELLTNLNEARAALGSAAISFGETVSSGVTVKATHMMTLRNGTS